MSSIRLIFPLKISLADLLTREGRLDEAQEIMEKVLEQDPTNSGLRYVFGEFLLRRGLADDALTQYLETIANKPEQHKARDRLYDLYLRRKMEDKSSSIVSDLEKALPKNPGLHYFKGRNALLDKNYEKGLEHILEAVKLMGNFSPAFRRAGLIERQLGKTQEAFEHLSQAIALDPNDIDARMASAHILFNKRDYELASQHITEVLKRSPRHIKAHVLRADIALMEGDVEQAKKVYEYLHKAMPKNPIASYKLAVAEEADDNFERSAQLYLTTIKRDIKVLIPARRLITVRNKQKKKIPEIISELKTLRKESKKSKGEFDLLLGTISLANQKDPQRFEHARAYFLSALEENTNLTGAYFALGTLDSVSGKLEDAVGHYRKILEHKSNHIPTQMLLAQTFEKLSQYDDAAQSYREILNHTPRFGPALNNLAWLLAEEVDDKDLDEAHVLASKAKDVMSTDASVTDTLGWIQYRRGNYRIARSHLEEAVKLNKESSPNGKLNASILYHLSKVYQKLEEPELAAKTVDEALAHAGPKHPRRAELEKMRNSL